jgi:hypothetical protein
LLPPHNDPQLFANLAKVSFKALGPQLQTGNPTGFFSFTPQNILFGWIEGYLHV